MKVTFDLSDADLRYFRKVMQEVRQKHQKSSEEEIVEAARSLIERIKETEVPEFIGERIEKLERLIDMLEDEEWALAGKDRERVVRGMAYFAEPDDMIPDKVPVIGFLDDAIMVELVVGELVHEIEAILERTGVSPNPLELAVPASVLMPNVERVVANLSALRDLGVTLAVDDFGSGFSSLGYLKTLPISRLKIDKSFIDGVTVNSNDDAIARAILALGRALGLQVIAEGVETEAQADFLRREGCNEAQGYLFGRPMTPDALWQTLITSNSAQD